jgi:phosphoglycerate dehydrogenase-like enzyme
MHVALWGPSDHVATAEADALRDRLAALDLIVSHVGADAAPNAETQVVIVNSKMQVGAKAFDWLKDLKLVVTTTSGYDHIDLAAARQRGIRVARCARSRRDAVVDTSLAMATALLRRLPLTTAAAAGGRWMRAEVKAWPVPLFSTLTVGILGQGVIGRRASEVWQALGATVLASDPRRGRIAGARRRVAACGRRDTALLPDQDFARDDRRKRPGIDEAGRRARQYCSR